MKKIIYRVKKDDTLFKVAKTFNISPFYLIKTNQLTSEIQSGDLLVINLQTTTCYQVKPFEQKEQILKKFCITEREFENLNGKIPYLFCGQTIAIPKKVK